MDSIVLQQTAAAFAALDFSEENERIAELEAEIAETESARASAERRCTEIVRAKADYRGPDGEAIADALMANVSPSAAASEGRTREAMETERVALRAAIAELNTRIAHNRQEISKIQKAAWLEVQARAADLLDSLTGEAEATAQRLAAVYAQLEVVASTVRCTSPGAQATRVCMRALTGRTSGGSHRLLLPQEKYDASPQIVSALRALEGKGAALPITVLSTAVLH